MSESNDILAHWGVLGMKWGKRKAQETPLPGDSKRVAAARALIGKRNTWKDKGETSADADYELMKESADWERGTLKMHKEDFAKAKAELTKAKTELKNPENYSKGQNAKGIRLKSKGQTDKEFDEEWDAEERDYRQSVVAEKQKKLDKVQARVKAQEEKVRQSEKLEKAAKLIKDSPANVEEHRRMLEKDKAAKQRAEDMTIALLGVAAPIYVIARNNAAKRKEQQRN